MILVEVWRDACTAIIRRCPNEYARAYAETGLGMATQHEIEVQALYLLNNIQHWRGDEAKRVRTYLKGLNK